MTRGTTFSGKFTAQTNDEIYETLSSRLLDAEYFEPSHWRTARFSQVIVMGADVGKGYDVIYFVETEDHYR